MRAHAGPSFFSRRTREKYAVTHLHEICVRDRMDPAIVLPADDERG
jgi:hypothetical protein